MSFEYFASVQMCITFAERPINIMQLLQSLSRPLLKLTSKSMQSLLYTVSK